MVVKWLDLEYGKSFDIYKILKGSWIGFDV